MEEVEVKALSLELLASILTKQRAHQLSESARRARAAFGDDLACQRAGPWRRCGRNAANAAGVRRMIGMVTLDDFLVRLAHDLYVATSSVTAQRIYGHAEPHTPMTTG